jgi:hypothetical protein
MVDKITDDLKRITLLKMREAVFEAEKGTGIY